MGHARTPARRDGSPVVVRAVLFDFDYTLADSSKGTIRCINHALAGLGLPPTTPEMAKQTIGLSLPDTLTFLIGASSPSQAERFTQLFLEMSERVMVAQTVLLPGTMDAMAQLRRRCLPLAIVSTKYHQRIEAVLEREGLHDTFEVLIGGDDVAQLKPAPEGLLLAASRLELEPAYCLYVGDSPTDAEAAKHAGMPFVASLSGVTPREALAAYQPLALIPDVGTLPAWLSEQRINVCAAKMGGAHR
jgi:phosphoglycolate phosphatase